MTPQSANAGNSRATLDTREERQRKNKTLAFSRRLIFEREFFSLAGIWLACRLKLMGGKLHGDQHHGTEEWHILGMLDYQKEMELLIQEVLG
jgi:hypothetical protein